MWRLVMAGSSLLLLAPNLGWGQSRPTLVLRGAAIVNLDSARVDTGRVVIIVGSQISQVVDAAHFRRPRGSRELDLPGQYLIPGLSDMHNHLGFGVLGTDTSSETGNLQGLLTWGITTVLNTGDYDNDSMVVLKRLARVDSTRLPHYFSVGSVFGAKGGWGGWGHAPTTPEEARADVRELKRLGADAVKLIYDDMSWLRTRPMPMLSPDLMRAIIDEAHRQGLKALVHAPILGYAKEVLRAGADGLVHGIISEPVDSEFLYLLKRNSATYTSTLTVYEACAHLDVATQRLQAFDREGRIPAAIYDSLRSASSLARWKQMWDRTAYVERQLPIVRANLKAVAGSGIPVLIGSDTGVPGVLRGIASQFEYVLSVEAGLTPVEALRAGTIGAAAALGRQGELGRIRAGAQADLLALYGDPEHDIANVHRIAHILRGGRIYDASAAVVDTLSHH